MLLKAALNGNRTVQDCRLVPITPEQLAADAQAAVASGVGAIHVHPRDKDGLESLRWEDIEPALFAIREACPGTPVGRTDALSGSSADQNSSGSCLFDLAAPHVPQTGAKSQHLPPCTASSPFLGSLYHPLIIFLG